MTTNACQKRYYRLMKRKAADDWPATSDVEPSPEVMPALQAQSESSLQTIDRMKDPSPVVSSSPVYFDSSPTTNIAAARAPLIWSSPAEITQTVDPTDTIRPPTSAARQVALSQGESTALADDSEDEPLIIPVPKAANSCRTARIATTQSVFNRKALFQHHRRKLRRESAKNTPSPDYSQGSAEPMKVDDQTEQQRQLEPTDPVERPEYETKSSPEEVATRRPEEGQASSASDGSRKQMVELDTPRKGPPSPSVDDKERVQPTKRKAMSLTLIRVRGKRHNKPKQESSEDVAAERERLRQEQEYDAIIDANLRRARDEAERQTSASKIERAERFIWSSSSPPKSSPSQRLLSPFEMDSSPTARVANNRHIHGQFPISKLALASTGSASASGSMNSYKNDSETPSSPPVLGGSATSLRRVRFDQEEHDIEDQIDIGIYGTPIVQGQSSESLPAWTDVVHDLLGSTVSTSPPGKGEQSMAKQHFTLGDAEDRRPKHHDELSNSHSAKTGALAKVSSRPKWVSGEKRKRHAASPKVFQNNNCPNHMASKRPQLHRSSDRVSKTHATKKRKPGF